MEEYNFKIDEYLITLSKAVGVLIIVSIIGLALFWKFTKKLSFYPILYGALTFIIFANILEQLVHLIFLVIDSPISRFMNKHIVVLMIYGALMAGLFEETGRYIMFNKFMNNYKGIDNAISFGIGHGGIEAILIGITVINVYSLADKVNNGTIEEEFKKVKEGTFSYDRLKLTVQGFKELSLLNFYMPFVERFSAVLLHISLSVLIYKSVEEKNKNLFYLSIFLHTVFDFAPLLLQKRIINIYLLEIIILIMSTIMFYILVWKGKIEESKKETEEEEHLDNSMNYRTINDITEEKDPLKIEMEEKKKENNYSKENENHKDKKE